MSLLETLHDMPEVSWQEHQTAATVRAFLHEHGIETRSAAGTGFLATIGRGAPHRLFRSDMDALPHGHRCGHDGHMAMLATALVDMDPNGTVTAFFQPAEEVGEGMAASLEHLPDVDEAYAFHNVPGIPLGTPVLGPGALASTGLRLHFQGQTSHAAAPHEPGDVWDDALAAAQEARRLGTLVGMRYGEGDHGIRPGAAEVAVTLRGADEDVDAASQRLRAMAHHWETVDPFPACQNDPHIVERLRGLWPHAVARETPFEWSEDFGHALRRWPGALIGIGAGDTPPLHDRAYRFPEALVEPGAACWRAIASS